MLKVCFLCLKPSKLKCSRCLTIQYCGKECQKNDWKVHKNNCIDSNASVDNIEELERKAHSYNEQGNYAKAEKIFMKLLKLCREQYGEKHQHLYYIMKKIARSYHDQGKFEQAEKTCNECLTKMRSVLGENHPDTLCTMDDLAIVYQAQGKYIEAEQILKLC